MGAIDISHITHYNTWTGLIKAYNMDFVVRVLAGFELANLN